MSAAATCAHRASIFHFLDDPEVTGEHGSYQYFADGLLLIEEGRVSAVGHAADLLPRLSDRLQLIEHDNCLITPGFIDTHVHYPQTGIIASPGSQLLEWLQRYTFPEEQKFADPQYARQAAERFLDQLLRAGTTTALVFATVHPQSVDAFFQATEARGLRMICGKVMMDCNAPDGLLDTAGSGYAQSKALIERWHQRGRLAYAVTPRFAGTSSTEQLAAAGRLLREHPDVYLQTHLAENLVEVAWVGELHPERQNYLDIYDHAGLLGRRSIFAHGLHLQDAEWQRLSASHSGIAFCPSSNLFLGSGLFDLRRAVSEQINVGIGTDIGAGTSFSVLQTLADGYKSQQLRGAGLPPLKAWFLATLGGARTLDLDPYIGNFESGKEADFVVIDRACTPLIAQRLATCRSVAEQLFVLSILGDDRAIAQTWSGGALVHQRDH